MSRSERDICTKFITPSSSNAVWDILTQIREEVSFTKGRVIERGKMTARGEPKRADYTARLSRMNTILHDFPPRFPQRTTGVPNAQRRSNINHQWPDTLPPFHSSSTHARHESLLFHLVRR